MRWCIIKTFRPLDRQELSEWFDTPVPACERRTNRRAGSSRVNVSRKYKFYALFWPVWFPLVCTSLTDNRLKSLWGLIIKCIYFLFTVCLRALTCLLVGQFWYLFKGQIQLLKHSSRRTDKGKCIAANKKDSEYIFQKNEEDEHNLGIWRKEKLDQSCQRLYTFPETTLFRRKCRH